ncbi:MAG: urease accessory protein UreH domain-containing protein, partial [Bacillota bacterium]
GNLGLVFLVGVLTSLHCAAMCGGFVLAQGFDQKSALTFHGARVLSYTAVGAAAGALGAVITPSGVFRGVIAVLAGLFMLATALRMVGLVHFGWPKWLSFRRARRARRARRLGREAKGGAAGSAPHAVVSRGLVPRGALAAGLLAGLMPCGPLNTMQIYALGTGSPVQGALVMLFFALGTLPLMGLISVLASMIGERMTAKAARVSAALLIGMGLVMANQGLALSGVSVRLDFARPVAAVMLDGKQVVDMDVDFGSYSPHVFEVRAGVPVEWRLHVKHLDNCISPITIPSLGLSQDLTLGDNVITFTPTRDGDLGFTCWMGMVRGTFRVKS